MHLKCCGKSRTWCIIPHVSFSHHCSLLLLLCYFTQLYDAYRLPPRQVAAAVESICSEGQRGVTFNTVWLEEFSERVCLCLVTPYPFNIESLSFAYLFFKILSILLLPPLFLLVLLSSSYARSHSSLDCAG